MCYLVTGINPGISSQQVSRVHTIFDTEADAKESAEALVRRGITEVAIWKQVATPSIETIINWETKDDKRI